MMRAIKRVNLVEAVADELLKMITNGDLKPGDKLPTENELTSILSVSRTPVREALRILNSIGILKTKQGEGTFVEEIPLESYMKPLRFMVRLDRKGIQDLMELRRILEKEIVKIAAQRANSSDIESLEKILKTQIESFEGGNDQTGIDASFEFHRAIAAASGNEILAKVLDITRDLLVIPRQKIAKETNIDEISVKHHKIIFEAVKSRRTEEAVNSISDHLNYLEELYLSSLQDDTGNIR